MSSSGTVVEVDPKYPIGRFKPPSQISPELRGQWIDTFANLPSSLRKAIAGLDEFQLQTPYRDGGWTMLQVVHHLADSHMNMYIRVRQALTEEMPTIKPYKEAMWAELSDAKSSPAEPSLQILEGVHSRLTLLLRSLSEDDFSRGLLHPEMGELKLGWTIGLYAWHGTHHAAHITQLRGRRGW